MIKKLDKIYLFYVISVIIFLFLTTKYLDLEELINSAGQMDIISYTEISKFYPSLPNNSEIIVKHIAQRFFIPYFAGLISFHLNLDLFTVYKIAFAITFYVNRSDFSLKEKILFFSLLFLNPYIVRHHIFQPVQAHDLIFFLITLTISYLIINKKYNWIIFFGTIPLFLRQTSIALFIGSLIILFINKKYIQAFLCFILFFIIIYVKKKSKSTYRKKPFLKILFFIIINYISYVSNIISPQNFNFKYAYGIILYDFSEVERLLRFLALPIISFFPLGIFLFSKKKNGINNKNVLIMLFICLMMIGQPILAGPDGSLRNVVRIATLCYPILVSLLFYKFDITKVLNNNLIFYSFVIGLFLWSFHPTFSIISFFGILRF